MLTVGLVAVAGGWLVVCPLPGPVGKPGGLFLHPALLSVGSRHTSVLVGDGSLDRGWLWWRGTEWSAALSSAHSCSWASHSYSCLGATLSSTPMVLAEGVPTL